MRTDVLPDNTHSHSTRSIVPSKSLTTNFRPPLMAVLYSEQWKTNRKDHQCLCSFTPVWNNATQWTHAALMLLMGYERTVKLNLELHGLEVPQMMQSKGPEFVTPLHHHFSSLDELDNSGLRRGGETKAIHTETKCKTFITPLNPGYLEEWQHSVTHNNSDLSEYQPECHYPLVVLNLWTNQCFWSNLSHSIHILQSEPDEFSGSADHRYYIV